LVNGTHLVDTLLKLGVNVVKVFAPEHGFRGDAAAGKWVNSDKDEKTGLPLISLYGKNKKPTQEQLSDVDVVIFDIQDVGVRFYTYISTMSYVIEAAADFDKMVIVLDRPNPNGFYVDGPVLEKGFESFVGLHPIPIVHGLTVGEYAMMSIGEKWLNTQKTPQLKVIKCLNYTHNDRYQLTVSPSPNLPTMESIYLYPSICLFEGTNISVGRGTPKPFEWIGHPEYTSLPVSFTIEAGGAAGDNPKHKDKLTHGMIVSHFAKAYLSLNHPGFNLYFLKEMYSLSKDKNQFFISYFEKLAGTANLRKAIKDGLSDEEIRKSWEPQLSEYKKTREKYLLYP
jgi:uncharacterized protein YbbC (DUF1343 family)